VPFRFEKRDPTPELDQRKETACRPRRRRAPAQIAKKDVGLTTEKQGKGVPEGKHFKFIREKDRNRYIKRE